MAWTSAGEAGKAALRRVKGLMRATQGDAANASLAQVAATEKSDGSTGREGLGGKADPSQSRGGGAAQTEFACRLMATALIAVPPRGRAHPPRSAVAISMDVRVAHASTG